MKLLFFSLLFVSISSVYSQNPRSYFYNEKGQFLLDTTLTISKEQYEKWWREEFNLLAAFSNIDYPKMQLENNIDLKEPAIVSFTFDSIGIKEISVLSDIPAFSKAINEGIKQQESRISYLLNPTTGEKYYIAISFVLVNFYEKLKEEGAVPIISGSRPLISTKLPPLKAVPLKE